MYALIQTFFRLCLFSARPQDLPASQTLLFIALVLNWLVGVGLFFPSYGLSQAIVISLVSVLVSVVLLWLILRLRSYGARFQQTMTAMLGADVVLGVLMLPLNFGIVTRPVGQDPDPISALGLLVIVIWAMFVYAHIFRHTLSTKLSIGFAVSLVYVILGRFIISLIFPALSPAA